MNFTTPDTFDQYGRDTQNRGTRGSRRRGSRRRGHRRHDHFGPRGHGPHNPHGPRGGRRRGQVRQAILALLTDGPRNGYQLMTDISERSQGLWRPSAGSIYPALGLLHDEGLIAPADDGTGKTFELTDTGRAHVAEHADELHEPWAKVAEPMRGYLNVRDEMAQLALALKQVAVAGDPEQIEKARGIVDDARKQLYRMLAE